MTSAATYHVTAIGNAIVDVLARADDALLTSEGLVKGSMQLIDQADADRIYGAMGPAIEMSGGSAANTLAGMAALGSRCGFIGQVADDQLGRVFTHDLTALGVAFPTPAATGGPGTGRCLILVTPDGQRTMNTFLGASTYLPAAALDEAMVAASQILYLEGYLWDPAEPRAAMQRAMGVARAAGRQVALTLSDIFVIARHGDELRRVIGQGDIDILFANENELCALARTDDFDAAVAVMAPQVTLLVATRSEQGAIACRGGQRWAVAARPIDRVVDTTGAGDLFAAGMLWGLTQGAPIDRCLQAGAICAHTIIGQMGPRAQCDLAALVAAG